MATIEDLLNELSRLYGASPNDFFNLLVRSGFPVDNIPAPPATANYILTKFCISVNRVSYEKSLATFKVIHEDAPAGKLIAAIYNKLKRDGLLEGTFNDFLNSIVLNRGPNDEFNKVVVVALEEKPLQALNNPDKKVLRWLHLSDFHCGCRQQEWLWPNIRAELKEDLKRLEDEMGGAWDVVFFSGDLAFSGEEAQYQRFNNELSDLFKDFDKPYFLSVPGNHDLVLEDEKDRAAESLKDWYKNIDEWDKNWEEGNSYFGNCVQKAFLNYMNWWRHDMPFKKPIIMNEGGIPGDFTATLDLNGIKLGVLGLNTAFTRLFKGDSNQKLGVHIAQFVAACNEDYVNWTQGHDFCFIMTHHPSEWLHPTARDAFLTEIAPAGRFVMHLQGHMHENIMSSMAKNGAPNRRYVQAASLFGRMKCGDSVERRHGLVGGEIAIIDGESAVRVWPRIAKCKPTIGWNLVPDYENYVLENDHGTGRDRV